MNTCAPEEAVILCDKGWIRVCGPMHCPSRVEITKTIDRTRADTAVFKVPLPKTQFKLNFPNSEGMIYQVKHVEECLSKGLLESPVYPLQEALCVAKVSDAFISAMGIQYPANITSVQPIVPSSMHCSIA